MQSPVMELTTVKRNPAGPLTHREIAKQLGVSRQLVGFALRGEGRMSDEVRRQILEVAHQNGYDQYSNQEARAMASRRHGKRAMTGVIAVLFQPTFQGQPLSSVPHFMPFFEGVESEIIERGLDVLLCPLRSGELPRLLRQRQVDGVISMVTDKTPTVELQQLDLPTVNIILAIGQRHEADEAPSLRIDITNGFALATRHLIELGHRRIACFKFFRPPGSPDAAPGFQPAAGYGDALREAGIPYDESLVDLSLEAPTVQAGTDAMKRTLARGPLDFTGLVCHNDLVAMGAIRALQEAGYSVPGDISVTGFDDVSTHYAFTPAVTTVRFPRQQMGRRAVELLCENLGENKPDTPANTPEVFPVELVERDSTQRYQP